MSKNKTNQRISELWNELDQLDAERYKKRKELDDLRIKRQKYVHDEWIEECKELLRGTAWTIDFDSINNGGYIKNLRFSSGRDNDGKMVKCNGILNCLPKDIKDIENNKFVLTGLFSLCPTMRTIIVTKGDNEWPHINHLKTLVKKFDIKLTPRDYSYNVKQYEKRIEECKESEKKQKDLIRKVKS